MLGGACVGERYAQRPPRASREAVFCFGSKTNIKKKTRKQNVHGIVPGLWGEIMFVLFLPTMNEKKKTHKQKFGTHPVPGQSRKFVYVYVLFLSLNIM